jgi:AraC family transcriptional regulator
MGSPRYETARAATALRVAGPGAVARVLGLDDAPALFARISSNSAIQINRFSCGPAQLGRRPETPRDDSFVLALYLIGIKRHEMWRGGQIVISQSYAPGTMRIVHLAEGYSSHLYEPHETICITLPRLALDAFADDAGGPRIAGLACMPGTLDPVVCSVAEALCQAFVRPDDCGALVIDCLGTAICAHLAHSYGGFRRGAVIAKGGLAAYQERRAKELLEHNLVKPLSLPEIARECGLSVGHFARAFRATTGRTPHQWLEQCRLEKAKDLLLDPSVPIADIAAKLGFSDQSHLTRRFGRMVGESPAAWRRLNARRPPVS